MDGGGFEPPKALLTDLQSAPFGHSGTHPYVRFFNLTFYLYHIFHGIAITFCIVIQLRIAYPSEARDFPLSLGIPLFWWNIHLCMNIITVS